MVMSCLWILRDLEWLFPLSSLFLRRVLECTYTENKALLKTNVEMVPCTIAQCCGSYLSISLGTVRLRAPFPIFLLLVNMLTDHHCRWDVFLTTGSVIPMVRKPVVDTVVG